MTTEEDSINTHDARELLGTKPLAKIMLDQETYLLKITKQNKLILTKWNRKEVKLLGSLLVKSRQVESLSKKAKVVAFLIDEDLKKGTKKPKKTQIIYINHLH